MSEICKHVSLNTVNRTGSASHIRKSITQISLKSVLQTKRKIRQIIILTELTSKGPNALGGISRSVHEFTVKMEPDTFDKSAL